MRRFERLDPRITEKAARWLARRDAGWDQAMQAVFDRWTRADPRHRQAVTELQEAWSLLDAPRVAGREDGLRWELSRLKRRRRQRWAGVLALVAVVLAGAGGFVARSPSPTPSMAVANQAPDPRAPSVTARIALPDQQLLSDGSMVELAPSGHIEVEFTDTVRGVRLIDGEAHFVVAKDHARPFVVRVGGVEVRAVGTAFAVRVTSDDVEVMVSEGRVAVDQPVPGSDERVVKESRATLTFLDAGERVIVPLPDEPMAFATLMPEVSPITAAELNERLAWRLPRLEFTDTTLVEAAKLFNRHGDIRLEADAAGLASIRVTGLFRADNVEGFVALLESSFGVQVDRGRNGVIVLRSSR